MAGDQNPFETDAPAPARRDAGYGLPMFLGAWIGAIAQDLGTRFPSYGFIAFLTAVVMISFLAASFNRRGGS